MASKRKARTGKGRKAAKTGRLRLYAAAVLVLALFCGYIVYSELPLRKIPVLGYLVQHYDRMKDIRETIGAVTWEATLCFGDENSDYLIKEYRKITCLPHPEKKAAALVSELIKGPQGKAIRTLPESTRLRSVTLKDDGLMIVDLSGDLIQHHPGGSTSEMMTVFSLVNTITMNTGDVRRVKLLVDGKTVDTIAGHIDCREAIAPQPALVH